MLGGENCRGYVEWPKDGVREVEWEWTIDCTFTFDYEPVICDPFCGSGCLSRAVRVIAFRFSCVPHGL